MCTAFFAVAAHPRYPLLVLANRDEFLARPTQAMHVWESEPYPFVAGKDLEEGGAWLGASFDRRLALLTNYYEPSGLANHPPSRGALVTDYLRRKREPFEEYLKTQGGSYAGFNIIFGPFDRLTHYSNRSGRFETLSPGLHGLSNSLLNTPWPKVTRGLEKLARLLACHSVSPEELFEILDDTTPSIRAERPDIGVSRNLEHRLASIRIPTEGGYGSRCATVMLVNADGSAELWERSYETGHTVAFEIA